MRKGYHVHYYHRPMVGVVLIGIALLMLIGLKGILFPLLIIGAVWWFCGKSACGRRERWHERWSDWSGEKPKNDDEWDGEYI